jgi:methionyl-tRNA synthetase
LGGYFENLKGFRFNLALEEIWRDIKNLDVEINEIKPWSLPIEKANPFLTEFTKEIRKIAFAIKPFLPETSRKIEEQFKGPKITSGKPLFPRI